MAPYAFSYQSLLIITSKTFLADVGMLLSTPQTPQSDNAVTFRFILLDCLLDFGSLVRLGLLDVGLSLATSSI